MTDRERLMELIDMFRELDAAHDGRTWTEHLADHLHANGIIVPHCKVGDTIYRVHPIHNIICDWVIIEIIITEGEINYIDDSDNLIKGEDIGKTVFLTEEEAERALAERGKYMTEFITVYEKIKSLSLDEMASLCSRICKNSETCEGCPFETIDCPCSESESAWKEFLQREIRK